MKTRVLAMMIVLLSSTIVNSYSNTTPYHPSPAISRTSDTKDLIRVLKPTLDPEIASVHAKYIDESSEKWGLKKELIISVAFHESEFDSCAISPKGAKGVMQVMERVHKDKIKARRLAPGEIFNLKNNYDIGCEILYDAKREHETLEGALTAYVGGQNPAYIRNIKKSLRKLSAQDS